MVDTPRIKMARILLRLLENPNGITFNELSDSYGIDDRTRRTYIADLKEIPEFLDEYGKSRVEVDGREDTRRVYLRPLNISKDDEGGHVIALYFAISMLRFLKGTDLEDKMQNLFGNLYKGKNKNLFYNLDKNIYSINEWPKDYSKKANVLKDCLHSMVHRKILRVNYKAVNKRTFAQHELKIYTLLQYRNGLYLIGRTEKGDRITLFALERVTKTEKTGTTFNYPSNYSPQDYVDGAFGLIRSDGKKYNVVVNFSSKLNDVITSRKWHKTSSTKTLKDGTIQLSMTVSALEQVLPWVLSFGNCAKVLKPKELKDSIQVELEGLAASYNLK
jgi:predicted DNA-binding transcriptional regulator YafY